MKQITCAVIEDLMPSYVDGLLSEESRALVEEHLADCPSCRALLHSMQTPLSAPNPPKEDWELDAMKKYRRRTRLRAGLAGAGILLAVLLVIGSYFRFIKYNAYRYYFADSAAIDALAQIEDSEELPEDVRLVRDLQEKALYLYVEYKSGNVVIKDIADGTYHTQTVGEQIFSPAETAK